MGVKLMGVLISGVQQASCQLCAGQAILLICVYVYVQIGFDIDINS
jgi:hypothetical protein